MSDIREATFNDYEEIMELMQRFEMPYKTKKEWKGIWENNPMIADDHISWTIGWVVVNDEGRVVGYLGNIPLAYELNGKRLIAAVSHAWVVDVEFRKYSVLLINSYFNQGNVDMLLNTTGGNSVTIKIFSAYKAKRAPVDQYDVARFCITNYKGFLTALLKKKRVPLYNIIIPPLSFATWCVDKLTSVVRVINGCIDTLVEVKACKGFDDRFDIFWDELRGNNKGLLCVRNRKYLHWRFKHAILNNRVWLFVAERENRIVGYVILMKDDKFELSLKRIKVVDLQIVDNDTETMNKLISHSINKCSAEGIDMLEMIGFNTKKRDCLKRYLPYKRQLPVWPFYLAKDNQVADELEKPNIWELCLFDGDGSF